MQKSHYEAINLGNEIREGGEVSGRTSCGQKGVSHVSIQVRAVRLMGKEERMVHMKKGMMGCWETVGGKRYREPEGEENGCRQLL